MNSPIARALIASVVILVGIFFAWRAFQPEGEWSAADQQLLAELNAAEGLALRLREAQRPGVAELSSGVLVEILETGSGQQPAADDWVQLHYRAFHHDGRVYADTWRSRSPATVQVSDTIAGWQAVLPSLAGGSRVRVIVPPSLAYGEAGGDPIGPQETLIFEIELLGISPPPPAPTERTPDQLPVPGLH